MQMTIFQKFRWPEDVFQIFFSKIAFDGYYTSFITEDIPSLDWNVILETTPDSWLYLNASRTWQMLITK